MSSLVLSGVGEILFKLTQIGVQQEVNTMCRYWSLFIFNSNIAINYGQGYSLR